MEQIQKGDGKALERLHLRHRHLLRTIISRITNQDAESEDILQDCLIQVWQNAANYSAEKGRVLGWIVTLVRRRSIDRIRRRTSYQCAQERLRHETSVIFQEHVKGSDEEIAQNDWAKAVASLIEKLPEAQQEVVRLGFYQGMSHRQIAAHKGIPVGTIKTRMELAMRKLRSAARAFGEFHGEIRANVIQFPERTVSCSQAA